MKILVTAKRVEDPESKIKVKPDDGRIEVWTGRRGGPGRFGRFLGKTGFPGSGEGTADQRGRGGEHGPPVHLAQWLLGRILHLRIPSRNSAAEAAWSSYGAP